MKKQLILIILLTFSLHVFGQHNIGVKINGGVSKISNSLISSNSNLAVQFAPSGHGGLFYYLNLDDRSIIGAELLFMQIEGKDQFKINYFDLNGSGQGTETIHKHISYLCFPIYYGFKFNKFTFNLGIQSSLVISSSNDVKWEVTFNGDVNTWDNKLSELNIDSYDFGPRAGIIFNLSDKFAIEGTYYFGVYNILDNGEQSQSWRVQQGTIGIRYNFLVVKKSKMNRNRLTRAPMI